MIPITINGEKFTIKQIQDLTTREFIEVNRIEDLNQLKYISWCVKKDLELIWKSKIDGTVLRLIGEMPDITKLSPPKTILNKNLKSYLISTVGQRFMIETNNDFKGFDLLVFVCAVALINEPDIDMIKRCMDNLYNLPFYETLPAGHFFFRNLVHGKNLGMTFFARIIWKIKTLRLKKRLESTA